MQYCSFLEREDRGQHGKSMKRNKPKENKKKTKRDKVSILEGSAGYSPGHIPPLKAALAPSGIVAWKTMPYSG